MPASSRRFSWTARQTIKKDHEIRLITSPRKGMDKSPERKKMIKEMCTKRNMEDYKERSVTVEPMQGLVADIFELDRCWMHRDINNRWVFAAMGIAVHMAQWRAYREDRSTWDIKSASTGICVGSNPAFRSRTG